MPLLLAIEDPPNRPSQEHPYIDLFLVRPTLTYRLPELM